MSRESTKKYAGSVLIHRRNQNFVRWRKLNAGSLIVLSKIFPIRNPLKTKKIETPSPMLYLRRAGMPRFKIACMYTTVRIATALTISNP